MKVQIIATAIAIALMIDACSAMGLLRGLGLYGNPMLGTTGCGCGCSSPAMYGYGTGLALSKAHSMGLTCPSPCCFGLPKPCLLSKLYMLKKKLMEKKMSLMGCGCGCRAPLCCGVM